jgi:hypothetical protein
VKSETFSSSATENTIVASTRLRISCCVVIGTRLAARAAP